jgi:hypothetical protein
LNDSRFWCRYRKTIDKNIHLDSCLIHPCCSKHSHVIMSVLVLWLVA